MRRPVLLAIVFASAFAAPPAQAGPAPRLTADGLGALRVGMTEAEAIRRFGLHLEQSDGEECHVLLSRDSQLMVFVRKGHVGSVTVMDASRVRTDAMMPAPSSRRSMSHRRICGCVIG